MGSIVRSGTGIAALLSTLAVLAWGGWDPARGAGRPAQEPACGVVNGGMEDVAPTLTPKDWDASSEVRSSPRARNGERSVVFLGRFGSLSQRLTVKRSAAEGATLTFWLRRDAALQDFGLQVYVGGTQLPLNISPANVPVDAYAPFQVNLPAALFTRPDVDLVFSYNRSSVTGMLDLDDVELDLCPPVSPTPGPTGPSTPVPDTTLCAVRNGGFEVLDGVRPRYWEWTGNVETTTRAMSGGIRSIRFTQGNGRLTQTLTGVPNQGRQARLWLWVYREEGAGGFRLLARVGGQQVLEYTPATLPVGQLPVSKLFTLPAPGEGGSVTVEFEWAMSGSGAVYLDEVGLDLCPATLPTNTPTASATHTSSPTPDGFPTTPTFTSTPTDLSTATATATASATGTASRTPSRQPTATSTRQRSIYLPFLAKAARMPDIAPRVWGLQLPLDEVPEDFATTAEIELPRAKKAGVTAVRTNVRWSAIEPADVAPEAYDWAATDARLAEFGRNGMSVLATVVDYPKWATEYACGGGLKPGQEEDWREFVRSLATRYGRAPYRITDWEIGNEVDGDTGVHQDDRDRPVGWGKDEPTVPHGGCWGDRPQQYVTFLRLAYEEIKAVNPDAVVTYGGLAYVQDIPDFIPEFFDNFLDAGGGAYFDVANLHLFPDLAQPLDAPLRVRRMLKSLAAHGLVKDIWVTETFKVTWMTLPEPERSQIPFLAREAVEILALPEVQRMYWYGWIDFPEGYGNVLTAQRGLVRSDHTPKAAFRILPYTIKHTVGAPTSASAGKVTGYRFRRTRVGEDNLVLWTRESRPQRYTLNVPEGTVADLTWFPEDMLLSGKCCGKATVVSVDGLLTFDVGTDPVFVTLR